jgi:hypothetical protein
MTHTKEQLDEIIANHGKWLRREDGGVRAYLAGADLAGACLAGANLSRADLAGANLSRADLAGACLAGANLSRANLSLANLSRVNLAGAYLAGANLSRANLSRATLAGVNLAGANLSGLRWVSVGWHGHGECGRMLTGLLVGGEVKYQCGCFYGTDAELRAYIANGDAKYAASRTKAVDFAASCLNEEAEAGK